MLLQNVGQHGSANSWPSYKTYLLVTNSELALRLLVLIDESFKLLDGLRLQDLDAKLDVAFGVLVAGLGNLLAHAGSKVVARLYARIRWYHPAKMRESRSVPCPSPWRCPRRSVHSLRTVSTAIGDGNKAYAYRR